MLKFDGKWRFDSPGQVETEVVERFRDLIDRIAGQANGKAILEHFKSHFSRAAGVSWRPSSDARWASDDLDEKMAEAAVNAPMFIEAFYDGCEALRAKNPDMETPDPGRMNRILSEAGAGYQIDPPNLVATRTHIPIAVPAQPPSLDAQAAEMIARSLEASERFLAEGSGRQAVQEVLWLLESIATAFRSPEVFDGGIQGRYFNKIIGDLQRRGRDHQEQILKWMMTLHGYLSSPTGGGVRHGVDLKEGRPLGIDEARLYCDLIRSYMTFVIAEHERLSRRPA